jgi:hypothetical protein
VTSGFAVLSAIGLILAMVHIDICRWRVPVKQSLVICGQVIDLMREEEEDEEAAK